MNPATDKRTVLTLDAGGTNFVFTAIRSNQEIANPVTLPSHGDNIEKCIDTMAEGFHKIRNQLKDEPVAISFAFPGPSDYRSGIIGKLNNLPAFTGGVPLAPILEQRFQIPVFINNDGDLYAYGEALSGFLPYVNSLLEQAGVQKQYKNLLGLTLGTGFGGGVVLNNQLLRGDNSMASEVWLLQNSLNPDTYAEEGISIRAVVRTYCDETGSNSADKLSPKEIYDIATGNKPGNPEAARKAFFNLGKVLGNVIGNLIALLDGVVVIGGGLSGAMPFILPGISSELNGSYKNYKGEDVPRLVQKAFLINDSMEKKKFLDWKEKSVQVPGSNKTIKYYPEARFPYGVSMIGTSQAVALGAYAYALNNL